LLEELFRGFCQHIAKVHPPWPGTGPVWTNDTVFRYFADACPLGLDHACKRPVGKRELRGRGLNFIWTDGDPYTHPNAPLVLALESKWTSWWFRRIDAWQARVLPGLSKVLRSNAHKGVLVTTRKHDPLGALTILEDAVARSPIRPKELLLVMLGPPLQQDKSCVAWGTVYDTAEARGRRIGPLSC
jgi:hypothetical protein